MDEGKKCPACGAVMEFEREAVLSGDGDGTGVRMELWLCPDCGRGELYLPQDDLERRKREGREEEKNRAWLRAFQEKVRAGEMTAAPFLCPTCGNLRRDRTCPICGSVVDLTAMEELKTGDPDRK